MSAQAQTFGTVPRQRTRRRRRGGLLLALALLVLAAVLLTAAGLARLGSAPVHVIVDGQEIWSGTGWADASPLLLAGGAVALLGLALLLVVTLPLLVLGLIGLVLLPVLLVVLCSVGLPLLIVGMVLAVLLSPILLALLLLGGLF